MLRKRFRMLRKSFQMLRKPFRTLRKSFRMLRKPFRTLQKSFRMLRKQFRTLPKSFRRVRKQFRRFRRRSGGSGNCFGAPEVFPELLKSSSAGSAVLVHRSAGTGMSGDDSAPAARHADLHPRAVQRSGGQLIERHTH